MSHTRMSMSFRGVARIFQRGGHTGSNNIVMAFSPRNTVGCMLKKRLTKGGSRAPQDPPSYTLVIENMAVVEYGSTSKFSCFGWITLYKI